MMDPDDAADVIGDLPYDKAEALLRLMGMEESALSAGSSATARRPPAAS